jgi:hypothetical protein
LIKERQWYSSYAPPGHFASPIPSIIEIKSFKEKNSIEKIPGVDLNIKEQLSLLSKLAVFYKEMPFQDNHSDNLRYKFINQSYSYSDAIFLYSMII